MAPQPVVLSGRILAYYDHICASVGHRAAYGLFRQAAGPTRQPQRVPNLLCQSVHPMPPPVLRWCQRLLATMPSSLVLPSPHPHRLGHHMSHPSGSGGSRNEAAAFASCYGLEVLQALLRPGPLRSSFRGRGRPSTPTSIITGWFIVIYHRRTFTGWTDGLMGCERMGADPSSGFIGGSWSQSVFNEQGCSA